MPREGVGGGRMETVVGISLVGQQGAGSYKVQKCVKDFDLYFVINEKPPMGSEQGSPLERST